MGQIGMLWLTNAICPAHEHFVSNLIRQRLFRAIDELPTVDAAIVAPCLRCSFLNAKSMTSA